MSKSSSKPSAKRIKTILCEIQGSRSTTVRSKLSRDLLSEVRGVRRDSNGQAGHALSQAPRRKA